MGSWEIHNRDVVTHELAVQHKLNRKNNQQSYFPEDDIIATKILSSYELSLYNKYNRNSKESNNVGGLERGLEGLTENDRKKTLEILNKVSHATYEESCKRINKEHKETQDGNINAILIMIGAALLYYLFNS